jgi:hypothetical protein
VVGAECLLSVGPAGSAICGDSGYCSARVSERCFVFSANPLFIQCLSSLLSNEDGLPNVSSVIVTPDTSIPVAAMRHYYFEVTLQTLPSNNALGIGLRSSSNDFFVMSNGTKWTSSRPVMPSPALNNHSLILSITCSGIRSTEFASRNVC